MAKRAERRKIDLEEGWAVMREGHHQVKNILEGKPEPQTIYNMCTQKPPHDYSQQLYDKYRESFEEYITSISTLWLQPLYIFVSNSNNHVLHDVHMLGNFGEVVNVELSMDRMVNLPRGYGYTEFKKRDDVEKALLYMDGGQIDGNVVKLRFTLQPRQRAASPMKAPPPPPKRDASQIENGVSSAEKDAQQRPRESVDYTCLSLLNLATSKAVEEPTKKATTSTSLSSSPTPSLSLQINFSKKGTRASIEVWVQEGYQGAAALEGLLEEEASLVTAEAAVHLPLDASGKRNPWHCVSGRSLDLKIYVCTPLDELDGPLRRQLFAINGSIEALKKYWMSEGCSILAYIDLGDDGRWMLNLAVDCSHGVSFLRSIELPSGSYDQAFVCRLVDSCIEEIGEKNVVQFIGDVGIEKTGANLPRKRPNIFWTQCAASSIDLMLEDIGHICLIKKTIAKARSLTAFIYAQTNLLDMTRKFTNQQDFEWEDSKWSKEAVGKKFYNLVVSNEFWHNVLYAINSFEPLVEVLRRMGSGRPSMGYIYGELMNAKKEIAFRFENKEEHYLPVWHHIDFRINLYMMKPLHLAAYYLNPWFYYQNRHEIENTEIFRDALFECAFSWWQLHDGTAKELSAMALRILRLTCRSLAYEPSWIEMIHKEKPSWIKKFQFEDSMFVTVNRRIQGKAQMRDRDHVLAYLHRDDEPFEWLVGMFPYEAQLQDNWDLLMARARSGDGVGLAKLANKLFIEAEYVASDEESDEEAPCQSIKRKTLSGASCSKREKRPRLVKGNLKDDESEGSDGNISY
ncbi:unnamed protein product [Miscanthus lutarioriparius]|uniref:RRM domain-containing protein n=1 Tax=Miscanthus lutarioriparius TaxID=422564 RepID=A0A811SHS9_9POAL|nr:unnamed protein product [Miscanthus lutarioriparius]